MHTGGASYFLLPSPFSPLLCASETLECFPGWVLGSPLLISDQNGILWGLGLVGHFCLGVIRMGRASGKDPSPFTPFFTWTSDSLPHQVTALSVLLPS